MLKNTFIGALLRLDRVLALSSLAWVGVACSSAPELEGNDVSSASEEVLQADETILAEIDVGYGTVRFYENVSADGTRGIAMSEQAPATYTRTPLDQLFEKYGALTSLEVFRALAPEQQPPAALVLAHDAETLNLGRNEISTVEAVFDRNAPVEKSLAACENFVFADPGASGDWTNKLTFNHNTTSASLYVVNSLHFTTANVTIGVCNESNAAIQGRRCWRTTSGGAFTCQALVSIPVATMYRWWNYTIVTSCPAPPGQFCGLVVSANHRVDGQAATPKSFFMSSAKLGPQACTTSAQCTGGQTCVGGTCQTIIH